MSVPVDVLVDIDGLGDRLLYSPALSHQDDDPFELCSMHSQSSQMDLGLELGLALEKSIKLRSQSTSSETPVAATPSSTATDMEILVKLEDSPDKKVINCATPAPPSRDSDLVFTQPSSNPFELAWDVIEQEALTLANHIQHDKEKPISPRKMVDMAMKLSPDSLLLSPRNAARDEEILIISSPEQELKKTPKVTKAMNTRRRPSIGASPAVAARSYATPLRQRPSLLPQQSPLRKPIKSQISASPAKPLLSKMVLKPPLTRSSSATAPLNQIPGLKPSITTKAAPLKAVHQAQPPPTNRAPLKVTSDTPLRRSVAPSPLPAQRPSFQSKLRTPLGRTESEASLTASKAAPDPLQKPGTVRYGVKRVSSNATCTPVPASNSSSNSRSSIVPRSRAKGRENHEPV